MHGIPWEELAQQQREVWIDEFLTFVEELPDEETLEELMQMTPHEAAVVYAIR